MTVVADQTLARGATLNADRRAAAHQAAAQTVSSNARPAAPSPAWTKSFNEPSGLSTVAPSPALNAPAQSTATSAVAQDQENQQVAAFAAAQNTARQAAAQDDTDLAIQKAAGETAAKAKLADKLQMPSRSAIRTAWTSLLPTYGLTLLYIDFHWLFSKIPLFSSFFSEPGQEWLPATMPAEQRKKAGIIIGLGEKIGIVLLNLLIITVFAIAITLILLLTWCLTSPIQCSIESFKFTAGS